MELEKICLVDGKRIGNNRIDQLSISAEDQYRSLCYGYYIMEDQRNADRSVATAVKFNEYDVLDVLGVWQQYEKLFSKEEDIRILKEKKRASFLTLRIRQVTPWSKCPNFTEKDELLNLITEKKEDRRGLGEVDWPPYRAMSIVLFCLEFIVLTFHSIWTYCGTCT